MASLHHQTNHPPLNTRKNYIHSHRIVHLSCMLTDSFVRNREIVCQWSFLLDQSHFSIQQGYSYGAWYLSCHFRRMDDSVGSSCWLHETQFVSWWKNPRRPWKGTCANFLFWLSCWSNLVRCLWQCQHFTRCKYGINCCSTHDGRLGRHNVRWNAQKRIWIGLRYFPVYRGQHFISHFLENVQPCHFILIIRCRIRRMHYLSYPFPYDQTLKN